MLEFKAEAYVRGRWQPDTQAVITRTAREYCGGELEQVRVKAPVGSCGSLSAFRVRTDGPGSGFVCTHKPHLSPMPDMIIGERAFRSPAIIFESDAEIFSLIPDLDGLEAPHRLPFMMDFAYDTGLYFGVGAQTETGHVYYCLTGEEISLAGPLEFSFYLYRARKNTPHKRDYRQVTEVLWQLFARPRMEKSPPVPEDLMKYAVHAYTWAFERWDTVCWQEFELGGKRVGGVAFIVTASQKPGLGGEQVWREPKSLWNQAWFCGLRSAWGYYAYGKAKNNADLMRRGGLALSFALSAPRVNGLFASYYEAGGDGSMESGRWILSAPRRPVGHERHVHLLDNSWTCYWLLKWHEDHVGSSAIMDFVTEYAETLLRLQRPDGGFPAWVEPESLSGSEYLAQSPESAAHAMLFCKLYGITGDRRYLESAERVAAFLSEAVIPHGRWEDFETYWSCAREWEGKKYSEKDRRSGIYSRCTFGMYWAAEAFRMLYELTGKERFLDCGERVLAEASLYQAICRPWDFPVETLGGFAAMNCDDEWNDARQSLFANTYLRYHLVTGKEEYRLRALWSLRASFYMMYCPENPETMRLYERVHPHFDELDYGFHMENFNHHDGTSRMGLGEFTIFDWGNGAACAALIEYLDIMKDLA